MAEESTTTIPVWKRKTVIVGGVTFVGIVIAESCGVTITTDTLSAVADIVFTFVSTL